MDTEHLSAPRGGEQQDEGNTGERHALSMIKEETRRRLVGVLEYHGWEHTELVAHYAKLIALGEGRDPFNAEMAGWTHDWGRASEHEDAERRPHAVLSGIVSADFYRTLCEEGKLTVEEYGDIQRAVRRHSRLKETERETLKSVRDADKLSRYGSLGLYHNVLGLVRMGKPFFREGRHVVRSDDTPRLRPEEKKSVVDDLDFCYDWKDMLETTAGKGIMERLKPTYREYMGLLERHTDVTDGEFWIAFLKERADVFKAKYHAFAENFLWTDTRKDYERWLEFYANVEELGIFSEESFREFRERRQPK